MCVQSAERLAGGAISPAPMGVVIIRVPMARWWPRDTRISAGSSWKWQAASTASTASCT
jgi:hypothetical protein